MKRVLLIFALLSAIGIGATPAFAEMTKLRIATNQNIDAAAFEVALTKGFFADEGLEVEITPVVSGSASLPMLAAGQIDIAASNFISIALAVKNNLPLEIIGAGDAGRSAPPDLAGIIVKTDSGIKTGKDLEGKRVATNSLKNIIWLFARAWIEQTGGDPQKVDFVEVPFPQMVDALQQGRVDAAFLVQPFISAGLTTGKFEAIGWPYIEVMPGAPVSEWVATSSFIKKNGPLAEKFARALNRASDWIDENEGADEWIKLVSAYTKIKPEIIKSSAAPAFIKTLDPAQIKRLIALMQKNGLLEPTDKINVDQLLHTTVLAP